MRIADRALGGIARALGSTGWAPPITGLLAAQRAHLADLIWQRDADRARALAEAASDGDGAARALLGELGRNALSELRSRVHQSAPRLAGIDRAWLSDGHEWLDDPAFDPRRRVRALGNLDAMTRMVGGYEPIHALLRAHLERSSTDRPLRVLDLAAGHAGVAVALARAARAANQHVHLTATDLKGEYLELARPAIDRERLPIELRAQDALDLSNVAPGAYDVVLCTQSLHHFPPDAIIRLVAEAWRVAAGAVLLFDICRSAAASLGVLLMGTLRFRDSVLAHDGLVSFRRAYAPEELALLARLGAPDAHAEASFVPPAHTRVALTR